jgi:homopolymeric O-antigen transport system ATP-binding protein
MPETVIAIENLSKRYLVGHQAMQGEGRPTLRDVIAREARGFVRKAVDALHGRQIVQGDEVEEFWALRHVPLKYNSLHAVM